MTEEDKIIIVEPKPYSEVGTSFKIYGILPKSWFPPDFKTGISISINLLNGLGKALSSGTSVYFDLSGKEDIDLIEGLKFVYEEQLSSNMLSFIEKTHGRMAIKLSGYKEDQFTYLPLIIKSLEPLEGVDKSIIEKYLNIEQTILQFQKDAEEYREKLEGILEQRRNDFEAAIKESSGLYMGIKNVDLAREVFEILEYSEDIEIKELEERYKETIEWTGPLAGGRAGTLDGYVFQVYSGDHDQHFHVIHRQRSVNARFSFPEIQLMSYKNSKNVISSKDQKSINDYFQKPDNFRKLEDEFRKQLN